MLRPSKDKNRPIKRRQDGGRSSLFGSVASTERDGTTILLLSLVPRTGDIHHVGDIVELHKAPSEKGEKSWTGLIAQRLSF